MAAVKGNKNGLGNSGGKSLQDRKLAAKVRRLALSEIYKALSMPKKKRLKDDQELYNAILIRLAGTVLPKLNEVTGEDGGAINISISDEQADKIFRRRARSLQGGGQE